MNHCVKSTLVDEIKKTVPEERVRIDSAVLKLTAKIADAETSKEKEEVTKKNELHKQLIQVLRFFMIFLRTL